MKAEVSRDDCIGCELCVTICPEVFEMDDEEIAIVIADPIPSENESEAKEAEDSCPTDAISITEQLTKEEICIKIMLVKYYLYLGALLGEQENQ